MWGRAGAQCGIAQGRCMHLNVDAVIGARGAAQGTQRGAASKRGMWLHWDAAWDAAGVRHAATLELSMR